MNCEQIYDLLSTKLDGALSAEDEARVQAHLDACPDCRRLYEAMASIEQMTADLAVPAPEGLKRGVMYRISRESGNQKKKKHGYWGVGTGFGLIAAVLVLLVGTGVIRLPHPELAVKSSTPPVTAAMVPVATQAPAEANAETDILALPSIDEGTAKGSLPISQFASDALHASAIVSPTQSPELDENSVPCDTYYQSGGSSEDSFGEPVRGSVNPMDEILRMRCASLSEQTGYPVLIYTEFSADSLLDLLAEAEPELYDRLIEAEVLTFSQALGRPDDSSEVVYATDYETMLAVQEWLVQNLPRSEDMDAQVQQAESELLIRLETLDPSSGALNRIVTWAPRTEAISWPETWPAGWAVRLRTGENWSLFYPTEDYAARPDGTALLVFPAD